MDIVDRLKSFIDYLQIPVTKFADNCGIPRPTLSQLTNGRNKSVRNELVEKIHSAYPNLSVLWLMFGEGDMLFDKNIQISEPQTPDPIEFNPSQPPINDIDMPRFDFEDEFSQNSSEKFTDDLSPSSLSAGASIDFGAPRRNESQEPVTPSLTINPDQSKRVVNIIVYYNDNTFESFSPTSR
jgi:DNA-binding protein